VFVCLLVTTVGPTKTDELIEVAFWAWTQVRPMNHVYLRAVSNPRMDKRNLGGISGPL